MSRFFQLTLLVLVLVLLAASCAVVKKDRARRAIDGPPGTVWLHTNVYMDQVEVTNFAWLEYLHALQSEKGPQSVEYLAALPDTTVWFSAPSNGEMLAGMYLRHPAYHDFPVVGISHEQARHYCTWRTLRVKELYANNPKLGRKWEDAFEYRLPTEFEWEVAAKAGLDNAEYPYGFEKMSGKKGRLKVVCTEYFSQHKSDTVPAPVSSKDGHANKYNLVHLNGNVAEMIAEENVSKGGSWNHPQAQCKSRNQIGYIKPEYWLGFRCVAVVTR